MKEQPRIADGAIGLDGEAALLLARAVGLLAQHRRDTHIYSRWTDEAAFEVHAELPRTVQFVKRMETLIDHPFDATRARPLG